MSSFEFVNHETFPDDQYITEAVTLCFDGKYRVVYVRKKMQTGGMYWSEISIAVNKKGEKKYLKSFSQDSNFLQEDIKHFLENRSWESKVGQSAGGKSELQKAIDEIPF